MQEIRNYSSRLILVPLPRLQLHTYIYLASYRSLYYFLHDSSHFRNVSLDYFTFFGLSGSSPASDGYVFMWRRVTIWNKYIYIFLQINVDIQQKEY